jgi:hypothetical protein
VDPDQKFCGIHWLKCDGSDTLIPGKIYQKKIGFILSFSKVFTFKKKIYIFDSDLAWRMQVII